MIDLEALNQVFGQFVPMNKSLGLTVVEASGDTGMALIRLPFDERWVGNPDTGVLHGGVVTTLLDASSGVAVYMRVQKQIAIATIDLRSDYLEPSLPRRDLFCRAECFKATRNVAFVRALAFHDRPEDPIATATGTFMLDTKGLSVHTRAGR